MTSWPDHLSSGNQKRPERSGSLTHTPRGDEKRFVVRADEKLTAFLELKCAVP